MRTRPPVRIRRAFSALRPTPPARQRLITAACVLAAFIIAPPTACGDDESIVGGAGSDDAGKIRDASADQEASAQDAGPCPPPANPALARLCLGLDPEAIDFEASEDLDGKGTLIVQVFSLELPTGKPSEQLAMYQSSSDAGTNPLGTSAGRAPALNVSALPKLDFDGLPEKVYVRTLFVDNPAWFTGTAILVEGMFVGGYQLQEGVQISPLPPAPLMEIQLTKGKGKLVRQELKALRKFTGSARLAKGTVPLDDGQGPVRIGVFSHSSPVAAPLLGGVQLGCKNLLAGPAGGTGYFYTPPGTQGAEVWFAGQLDDFNTGSRAGGGSVLSLLSDYTIPLPQKVVVSPRQYSLKGPVVELNFVLGTTPDQKPYACPGGRDAGPDAAGDADSRDGDSDDGPSEPDAD
jgi:hypothetical protein